MENKINIACFKEGSRTAEVKDIWQWDYGQILRIQGLNLPTAVEIHFSLDEHGGEAVRRIGVTKDGVTDVVVPDTMLENESTYGDSYYFFAYIYLTDETSGNTEYKIRARVSTRSKPEGYVSGGNDTFAEILKTVNEIAEDKVDIPVPAKVGQVLAVKATDESGKPTEFEATDPGGGVSDEKIAEAVGTYMESHPIEEIDPTVPEWAKQPEKPSYTAEEVGADASGTAVAKVSEHNTASNAHNDIRLLVQGLTERLNALADSDDTTLDQMSEVVAYIKSNKSLIDAITTSKINVSDIIDNLTTNVSNKPLSAAQGAKLKALIDAIVVPTKLSELEEDNMHRTVTDDEKKSWNNKYERPAGGIPASDLAEGAIPEGSASIDDASISAEKTWSSQKISDELEECVKFVKITVNLVGSEGNIPLGNTVYVYEIVNEIEILSYSVLCPNGTIIVRVPHGIQYRITASTDAEGFYAPTEVTGVAINDSKATIRYTELAYPKTIRDLQTLAKMGLASDVVAIGDEFTTTYTYDGNEFEMPWIVTDIKDVEFEDGSTGQGVYLEAKHCTIESIQFDAPHQEVATEETAIEGLYYIGRTDNTYTLLTLNTGDTIPYSDYTYVYHDTIRDTSLNIYKYGHNRVSTSAMRQWLNSDADKGQWWKAPKVGYCKPSQLNTQKGFMAGLSQEFIDCVARVKRTYYTNSVTDGSVIDVLYDKFFSATGTELYGSVNDNEGTYFPYYKEVTGLSAPSNSQNTGRIKYALNAKTSSQNCWAFSSYRGGSCSVWIRYTTGQLDNYYASYSYRAVPACVIG